MGVGEDPGVFAVAAALHGNDGAGGFGNADETAGDGDPAGAGVEDVGAEDDGPGVEGAAFPDGGGGQGDLLLGDVLVGPGLEAIEELPACVGGELGAEDGLHAELGKGGLDDDVVEVCEGPGEGFFLAAPPGGDGGELEVFAEEVAGEAGEKRHDGGRLDEAAAEGVGDVDVAGDDGVDQAGDAEEGVAAELEGIAEVVVDAAEDDVDLLEAADGFQVDAAVADGEVGAFDEGEVEVLGEVGVLEVGLVVGAGG